MSSRLANIFRGSWPLSFKVPLFVAILMLIVSAAISDRVLSRLGRTQELQLQQLASTYLDGLSSSLLPSVVRDDVWEVFDTLDQSKTQYQGVNVRWTVVADRDDNVIAGSNPVQFPSQSKLPQKYSSGFPSGQFMSIDKVVGTALLHRPLTYQGKEIGQIVAEIDISGLLAERSNVFWTLVGTNTLLTLLLGLVGFVVVRRMLKPVAILAEHFEVVSQGSMTAIESETISKQSLEFRKLFNRFNELILAIEERETLATQLAEEEKVASLGRLASGMAHEINNPLGGMFNALDALKNHGTNLDVRSRSIRLLDSGLRGIRDLVRSTLTSYRTDRSHRNLTPNDLDDLRLLIKPEARERGLELDWNVDQFEATSIGAVPVRDAVLNLLINACRASARGGEVGFSARLEDEMFVADISDSGTGLPANIREYIERKGAGSAPLDNRSGLGLWIVKRLCDEMNGALSVVRSAESGTIIRLRVSPKVMEKRDAA
jgi:signal transduction histidine kinase